MGERYGADLLEELPEIDGLIGTADYSRILPCVRSLLDGSERKQFVGLGSAPPQTNNDLQNSQTKTRVLTSSPWFAYLKIAEGCSNVCSFCNIPKIRGPYLSRAIEEIQSELKLLLEKGVKEINIISQDSSAYGMDLYGKYQLYELIQKLLSTSDNDFWLRIFYSYPNCYPLELLELMKSDSRLVPYIDMPFQHISDSVLKVMSRNITQKEIFNTIDKTLSIVPNITLRSTFIVGFPNEREKDFEELLKFVKQGIFNHIGVFTYSDEDNITSSRFGDPVPAEVKEERKNILLEAQQSISHQKNRASIGEIQKVLIEGYSDETDLLLQGRNAGQGPEVDGVVLINEGDAKAGEFRNIEILEAHPYDLLGKVLP